MTDVIARSHHVHPYRNISTICTVNLTADVKYFAVKKILYSFLVDTSGLKKAVGVEID